MSPPTAGGKALQTFAVTSVALVMVTLDNLVVTTALPVIRRDLHASLVGQGYRVLVYIPFGREWFPYFMRRLGERPENLSLVLRNVFRESRESRKRRK
jgi:hypothetical protein